MATPFDEASVDLCARARRPDHQDRQLRRQRLGADREDRDHCASPSSSPPAAARSRTSTTWSRSSRTATSRWPSTTASRSIRPRTSDLELNQIDFLRRRYPNHIIGFSTHEYHDWATSIAIAYAKGARTFERHIDIEDDGIPVSPYCSLPEQIDTWFKAWKKAKEMCGPSGESWRVLARRDRVPERPRARRLRGARPSCRPRPGRRGRLPGHPAAEGPDLLPRADARRGPPAGRAGALAHPASTPSTARTRRTTT